MLDNREPIIIQGGMGAGVSGWRLARAVSETGQLGVVSGTALDMVLARHLQLGDPAGHMRRAMAEFPLPGVAERVLDRYFIEGGKAAGAPFQAVPPLSPQPARERLELLVLANFVEVYLAREGHDGLVGVNFLEKIQLPTLPSLFGAMLAGVDYVLMGAGIPRTIPGILDSLARGNAVEAPYHVEGARPDEEYVTRFDPMEFCAGQLPWLMRPKFLAIIASATLATMLVRKSTGHVDGFVVEGPTAGGHNAPPRGHLQLNARGEPIYGPRDVADLKVIADLGRPFCLAGSYGDPLRVVEALEAGAAGVQVGTAFAYCRESDLDPALQRQVIALSRTASARVKTDPLASPTGFPFKVVELAGTISEEDAYQQRQRICDLGYLRHAYKKPDGTIGWRCPSEKVEHYVRKGGKLEDTRGRKCVCNGLMANISLAQIRPGTGAEKALVTSGDDVAKVAQFLPAPDADSYSAEDVVAYLLSAVETSTVTTRA